MVAVKRWSAAKAKALVEEVDSNWRALFPNDGDGDDLRERQIQKWVDLTESLNQRFTLTQHNVKQTQDKWSNLKRDARHYSAIRINDIQRVSGGGEREVADSPLLDKVLVVLQTYEAEAQNGIAGDEGEAGGGLGNLVRLRHSITPLSVRGRRRGRANETTPMPAVPDEETVELKKRKLKAEAETQRLQQQLIRQQIINAETEGAILSVKAAMVNQHRGT